MALNFQRLEQIVSNLKPNNQTGRAFHVCFVFKGNKMIRIGQNNYNKRHKSYKFGEL